MVWLLTRRRTLDGSAGFFALVVGSWFRSEYPVLVKHVLWYTCRGFALQPPGERSASCDFFLFLSSRFATQRGYVVQSGRYLSVRLGWGVWGCSSS
jgi:hypothetical protein